MKILFFYPNDYLANGIPTGIATLSSILKQAGHEVDIFDWTFVKTPASQKHREKTYSDTLNPETEITLDDIMAPEPVCTLEDAFSAKLTSFNPDIIALSVMTGFFDAAVDVLGRVKPSCLVVAGGVHATICPEDTLRFDEIDCICVGEGEGFFLDLCDRMERGKDYRDIENLGYLRNGQVHVNPLRPLIDMDKLPVPDWSLFDDRHLFRPFEGQVYRGSYYIMSRGCPERCTYCLNWAFRQRYKGCGRYFRYQSPQTTGRQIEHLKETYQAEWFRITDESMALFKEQYLEELADILEKMKIHFACSIRPETVNPRKVELLRKMGCVAVVLGVESGNPRIRREILNRHMPDKTIEYAVKLLKDAGMKVSTYNMIGLPGETREDFFKTVKLNKKLDLPTANLYVLYPYPGTHIHSTCNVNIRNEHDRIIPVSQAASFGLSEMPPEEVDALMNAFPFYLRLDESMWPLVSQAEGTGLRARKAQEELKSFIKRQHCNNKECYGIRGN